MTLGEYQALAERTINKGLNWGQIESHALHGMSAECGEIHSIFQKLYQGHMIDEGTLIDEVGDLMWFVSEFCTAHGWKLDAVCKRNIEKLKKRYPDGFSEERSVNRTE